MEVNKVLYGDTVLIDLTEDTVTPEMLIKGYTAHDKTGAQIVGTNECNPLVPYEYDYNIGYIDNGTWKYENPTNTYTDLYEVEGGHSYFLSLGENVGSRFRAMFTTTDLSTVTSGNITGTRIYNINNPTPHASVTYTTTEDGYIAVAKDNVGKSGVISYLFDLTKMCP